MGEEATQPTPTYSNKEAGTGKQSVNTNNQQQQNQSQQMRRGRQPWVNAKNRNTNPNKGNSDVRQKKKRKCGIEELADYTFSYGGKNMTSKWHKSKEHFINVYTPKQFSQNESLSLKNRTITIVGYIEPQQFDTEKQMKNMLSYTNAIRYEARVKEWDKQLALVQKNLCMLYQQLWSACEPQLVAKLERHTKWTTVDNTKDTLQLMELIHEV